MRPSALKAALSTRKIKSENENEMNVKYIWSYFGYIILRNIIAMTTIKLLWP